MPIKELRGIFPNFNVSRENLKSPPDPNYNCVAWALNDQRRWWEPFGTIVPAPFPPYHWPDNLPCNSHPQTYVSLFEANGFEITENGDNEDGVEKLAIYTREDEFTHVARQLPNGRWVSKVGVAEDIEHGLSDLESNLGADHQYNYGTATIFMRRVR